MNVAGNNAERKVVTFSLGGQMFGIPMLDLIEIREWEEPTPLPNVPGWLRGVTNLRGTVVPVIGLAERLGWAPSVPHARSCILIVNIAGKQAGFLVEDVADIVSINDSDIQPAPDTEAGEAGAIAGVVRTLDRSKGDGADGDGSMVLLLDLSVLGPSRSLDLAA